METTEGKPEGSPELSQSASQLAIRIMTFSGYALLLCSAGLAVFLAYQYLKFPYVAPPSEQQDPWVWGVQYYGDDVLILVLTVFLGLLGLRLLRAAGRGAPRVIPPEDRKLLEPLIADANKDAITQYVILSSLSGFTGTFQKIGFSGLPLATSFLTLVFSALSFFDGAFLELVKLTLGAFIGSFVQKGVDTPKLPTGLSS